MNIQVSDHVKFYHSNNSNTVYMTHAFEHPRFGLREINKHEAIRLINKEQAGIRVYEHLSRCLIIGME